MLAAPVQAACWEPEEYEAARMRDVQTVLMVSALKCGRAMPEMAPAYNRWVGRARTDLIEGEKKLLAHFVREGDKLKYDKFTTALANKYSELADHPSFCTRAKALFDADEAQNGILVKVVTLLNARPNGVEEMCPRQSRASVIVVSPFDALPVDTAAPAAASAPPAPTQTAAAETPAGATSTPEPAATPAASPAPASPTP